MRVSFFIAIMLLFLGTAVYGQQAKVKKYAAKLIGKVVLRDVEDKYSASVYGAGSQEPEAVAEQKLLHEIKAQVARDYPHKRQPQSANRSTSSVLAPVVGINYVADSFPGIPPDNYCAVSKEGQSVNVMNEYISVHNTATGAYVTRKGLSAFSSIVGLNGLNNFRYDPKVVYDPVADRFICVMLNGEDAYNWIVLAFSQSNDPTGTWNFYKFYGDYMSDTTWFDYPAISITQQEFFLTGNKVKFDSTWQAGFTRSVIYQVRKQDGYNGDTVLNYQIWDSVQYNNGYLRCLYPLNPGVNLLGPGQYFLSNRDFQVANDSMFLVQIPDTIGSIDSTLTVTPIVASMSYGMPPDGRQPDTSIPLATNDSRVLGGFIDGNEVQFVSTTLNTVNGASAVYHGVISNFTTTPSCAARLISIDTLDFGYPNISYAGTPGQSIISFDYTGPHTYPGFGAVLFDGSNYSDMTIIRSGDTTIHQWFPSPEQRWGDYSGSQPDWGAPGTVWVEGIFGRKVPHNTGDYGNYMAQLLSPYHEAVPTVKATFGTSSLYPNPSFAYVKYDFEVAHEQNFSFFVYDIQGRVVDKIVDHFCSEGRNIIQFNTAPFPSGVYVLKAVGANGEQIPITKFIRE